MFITVPLSNVSPLLVTSASTECYLELIIPSFIVILPTLIFFPPEFDKQYWEMESMWVLKLDTLESES